MDCAREEGREEDREEGIGKVLQKCFQKNMAIEDIVFLTGYSKDRILSLRKN